MSTWPHNPADLALLAKAERAIKVARQHGTTLERLRESLAPTLARSRHLRDPACGPFCDFGPDPGGPALHQGNIGASGRRIARPGIIGRIGN